MEIFLIILALVLIIGGLAGTIHPLIPGLPLMFIGTWILAFLSDYQIIGGKLLIFLGILTVVGLAMDSIASILGAKYTGASKLALIGAFIGGLIGTFFGLLGIVLGPMAGAVIGELIARQNLILAGKVGLGTFFGFIAGVIAKIGIAVVMLFTLLGAYLSSLF